MSSKVEELINKLIELDIQLELVGENNLKINKDISLLPADVLKELKEQKESLIAYLLAQKSEYGNRKETRIPKAEELDFYPASSAQKRLYFLQNLSPDSTSYNMTYYQVFDATLDKERLETSLKLLIDRHEILRTSFVEHQGVVMQKIEDKVEVTVEHYSCNTTEEADEIIRKSIRAFDLSAAPLLRSALIEVNGQYLWMTDIHHIVSDGTSQEILIGDMMAIYQGEELPEITINYKDYSQWQNTLREKGRLEGQFTYWKEELSGELPQLNFPADYPRPQVFTFNGARHEFTIDENKSNQLRQWSEAHGGTLPNDGNGRFEGVAIQVYR